MEDELIEKLVIIALLILGIVIVLVVLIKGLDNRLQITGYQMTSPKVEQVIRVSFLSDLHSCRYGQDQSELIKEISTFKPDLIMLGGDIIDDRLPESPGFLLIKNLVEIAPCFYVTGNHEFYSLQAARIKQQIANAGVTVLAGQKASLEVQGNVVNVIGIDDPIVDDRIYQQQLDLLSKMQNPEFTFFLAHHPERIRDYQKVESDLVLSGHAHGGQWRIPLLNRGIIAPHQGLFPKYTSGFYDLGNTTLLVSRGLNRESTKVPRVFNPPELIELTISSIKGAEDQNNQRSTIRRADIRGKNR